MNEMLPPVNQVNEDKVARQSRAMVWRTVRVRGRGLLCFVGLLILGLVLALAPLGEGPAQGRARQCLTLPPLALPAPSWGGPAHAQEPTATPTVRDAGQGADGYAPGHQYGYTTGAEGRTGMATGATVPA